ncbi:glycosyltransferase [Lactobacillus delbrueckii subsp. bulgaricus]|nr:glycosyltransferase [Lactobacillus delbrueckii subsp. bulgaricus]
MEKELISIVVPVYNCENKNISRSLNSIKDQTYKNFEVIIIDDCSTDNTVSLVKEQIKDDPRFTLHSLKTNGGVSNASVMSY